jgi:hypothetical protein
MQADQPRLAKIIQRIDAGIAANEQATPCSPRHQPTTAVATGGPDTGAEPHLF